MKVFLPGRNRVTEVCPEHIEALVEIGRALQAGTEVPADSVTVGMAALGTWLQTPTGGCAIEDVEINDFLSLAASGLDMSHVGWSARNARRKRAQRVKVLRTKYADVECLLAANQQQLDAVVGQIDTLTKQSAHIQAAVEEGTRRLRELTAEISGLENEEG